ncbi:hypothetical protein PHAMO_380005 [Magnetospirillum molischianum DSM 120]|uniref:HTH cro/C1-type domain-containing protein n=1 Tax=Magnetospirillum molischianum DSM 120 TaxID=1150626 RepID=H8FVE9_MAGML|nr:hypothetical protein PHAMO_380005 [Magnetospirillum molischianum DSM 120]
MPKLYKYERGIDRIGASRLYQIATALGVSPEFFFEELGAPRPGLEHFPFNRGHNLRLRNI